MAWPEAPSRMTDETDDQWLRRLELIAQDVFIDWLEQLAAGNHTVLLSAQRLMREIKQQEELDTDLAFHELLLDEENITIGSLAKSIYDGSHPLPGLYEEMDAFNNKLLGGAAEQVMFYIDCKVEYLQSNAFTTN